MKTTTLWVLGGVAVAAFAYALWPRRPSVVMASSFALAPADSPDLQRAGQQQQASDTAAAQSKTQRDAERDRMQALIDMWGQTT